MTDVTDTPDATPAETIGDAFEQWWTRHPEDPSEHPSLGSYAECVFGAGYEAGAARAAAAQREADIKLADDCDAIYVARGDDERLTGMLRFADVLAAAPATTPQPPAPEERPPDAHHGER